MSAEPFANVQRMQQNPSPLKTALDKLDQATRGLLTRYHFDEPSFLALAARLAEGNFTPDHNRLDETIAPPSSEDLVQLEGASAATRTAWKKLGDAAIERGEVAIAVLNGGMATRFGGRVKGIVDVLPGHSFLSLKLRDAKRYQGKVAVFLMNSFATDQATREHLASPALKEVGGPDAKILLQSISMRLTASGELFIGADKKPSLFAPGHGDLLAAARNSPEYRSFVAGGGKYVLVSNVDNLGARVDPTVVGAHIAGKRPVSVEVAPKEPGDAGGAPVRRQGRVEILEGFRFPADFDQEQIHVFNTNSFLFDAEVLLRDCALTWFRADKKVEGASVVQFERLIGELTSFEEGRFLQVSRKDGACRFLPVKSPGDLPLILPFVERYLLPTKAPS